MNEAERLALVQRWLRYAREDLLAAEAMLGQQNMWPRHACWLAQQARSVWNSVSADFAQRGIDAEHAA